MEEKLLLDLIANIYDAVLEPSLWDGCLVKIAETLSGISALALTNNPVDLQNSEGYLSLRGNDDHYLAIYQHLQRALQIRKRLSLLDSQASATLSMLDVLDTGVVLLGEQGSLVYANRTAKTIAADRLGLVFDMNTGNITTSDSSQTNELQHLIEQTARTGLGLGSHPGGSVCLRTTHSSEALSVLVVPLPLNSKAGRLGTSQICAALFVSRLNKRKVIPASVLKSLFGLTPAESRLVGELVQGLSLEEIAEQRGISPCTARNQLRTIFAKTDTSRQAELVKLVLSCPAGLVNFERDMGAQEQLTA